MKKLILTSLLSLTSLVCLSQDIYKVKVKSLDVGYEINDSTYSWTDSIMENTPTILIYQDSLIIDGGDKILIYKFLNQEESNPGINAFKSTQYNLFSVGSVKNHETCLVTFFTSSCLDNTTITVIVEIGKESYNYVGSIIE